MVDSTEWYKEKGVEYRNAVSKRAYAKRRENGKDQEYHRELYQRRKEIEAEQARQRQARFYEKHGKSYSTELNRNWRKNNPEAYMVRRAKERAMKSGLECTITVNDIFIPDVCPLLGIPLVHTAGTEGNTQKGKDNSPSLDRIDSTKGYIPGNVWVISNRANKIKNNATVDELEKIVAGLKQLINV